MKEYDLIVAGTGSAMNIVEGAMQENLRIKVAVIDKDDLGGIVCSKDEREREGEHVAFRIMQNHPGKV